MLDHASPMLYKATGTLLVTDITALTTNFSLAGLANAILYINMSSYAWRLLEDPDMCHS